MIHSGISMKNTLAGKAIKLRNKSIDSLQTSHMRMLGGEESNVSDSTKNRRLEGRRRYGKMVSLYIESSSDLLSKAQTKNTLKN